MVGSRHGVGGDGILYFFRVLAFRLDFTAWLWIGVGIGFYCVVVRLALVLDSALHCVVIDWYRQCCYPFSMLGYP